MGAKKDVVAAMFLIIVVLALVAYNSNCSNPSTADGFVSVPELKTSPAADSDLLNRTWWNIVSSSYTSSTLQAIPQTVLGFIQGSQEWQNWTETWVPDPPNWVTTGPLSYFQGQYASLEAEVLGSGNATKGAQMIYSYVLTVDGFDLESVNFLSLNSLSAVLTFAQTGSITSAICATTPGQLGQLFNAAFDSSLTSNERAHYLGQALAFTSIIAIAGGIGGFSDEFEVGLEDYGISVPTWDSVKPYLYDIGQTVSTRASELTLQVFQALAQHFPNDIGSVAAYTAYRISTMSTELHNVGIPNSIIENDIGGLIQAAGNTAGPDDVAIDADKISYGTGGQILVRLSAENQMFLYVDSSDRIQIQASFLQDEVPGFVAGHATVLKVFYPDGVTYYQYYSGGQTWLPTAPSTVGSSGDVVAISVQVLTEQDFVDSLPSLNMANSLHASWVATEVQVTGYSLSGDELTISAVQPDEAVPSFSFQGVASDALGFNSGRTFIQFTVTDVFQETETLRIYYNGHDSPYFAISYGSVGYKPLNLISFDGTRLDFVQGPPRYTTTIYLQYPNSAYAIGDVQSISLAPFHYLVTGYSFSYGIADITITGQLEDAMAHSTDTYAIGRVGAEIAYNLLSQKFGVQGLQINTISQGGVDLINADGTVVVQARLLMRTAGEDPTTFNKDITSNLNDLIGSLNQDFEHNDGATTGYAVLSYANSQNSIQTIILIVEPP